MTDLIQLSSLLVTGTGWGVLILFAFFILILFIVPGMIWIWARFKDLWKFCAYHSKWVYVIIGALLLLIIMLELV